MLKKLKNVAWARSIVVAATVIVAVAATVTAVHSGHKESPAERAYNARWSGVPAGVDRVKAERFLARGAGWVYADGCRVQVLLPNGQTLHPDINRFGGSSAGVALSKGELLWGCSPDGGAQKPNPVPTPQPIRYVAADAQRAALVGDAYQWLRVDTNGKAYVTVLVGGIGVFQLDYEWFYDTGKIPPGGAIVLSSTDLIDEPLR